MPIAVIYSVVKFHTHPFACRCLAGVYISHQQKKRNRKKPMMIVTRTKQYLLLVIKLVRHLCYKFVWGSPGNPGAAGHRAHRSVGRARGVEPVLHRSARRRYQRWHAAGAAAQICGGRTCVKLEHVGKGAGGCSASVACSACKRGAAGASVQIRKGHKRGAAVWAGAHLLMQLLPQRDKLHGALAYV